MISLGAEEPPPPTCVGLPLVRSRQVNLQWQENPLLEAEI